MVKIASVFILFTWLAGCAWVDRKVSAAESSLNKSQACEQQFNIKEVDYSVQQSYRCRNGKCDSYGCKRD